MAVLPFFSVNPIAQPTSGLVSRRSFTEETGNTAITLSYLSVKQTLIGVIYSRNGRNVCQNKVTLGL